MHFPSICSVTRMRGPSVMRYSRTVARFCCGHSGPIQVPSKILPLGITTSIESSVSFRSVRSMPNIVFRPPYDALNHDFLCKQVLYKVVRNTDRAIVSDAHRWRIQEYEHTRTGLSDPPSAGIRMILPMPLERRVAAFHG